MSYNKFAFHANNMFRVFSATCTETAITGLSAITLTTNNANTRILPYYVEIYIIAETGWTSSPTFALGYTATGYTDYLSTQTANLVSNNTGMMAYSQQIAISTEQTIGNGTSLVFKWSGVGGGTARTCNLSIKVLCLEYSI